jgi:hypothetical protein
MSERMVMKKGQWLTHEGGERYAVALKDIPYHDQMSSEDFEMADGTSPLSHSAIPTDVIKVSEHGVAWEVCIDSEWVNLSNRD